MIRSFSLRSLCATASTRASEPLRDRALVRLDPVEPPDLVERLLRVEREPLEERELPEERVLREEPERELPDEPERELPDEPERELPDERDELLDLPPPEDRPPVLRRLEPPLEPDPPLLA